MSFQKTLLVPLLITVLAFGTSLCAQNWSFEERASKHHLYVLTTQNNTARMIRKFGETNWSMELYFRDPPANVDPKIEFILNDGSTRTFSTGRKYMNEGPYGVDGLTSIKFSLTSEMLELFQSAKALKFRLGKTTWTYPLSGSRYAIAYAEDIIDIDIDEEQGFLTFEALDHENIKKCDSLTAHHWDNSRSTKGVAWDDLDGEKAVTACKAALKSDPNNSRLQYQLARAYDKLGDARAFGVMETAARDNAYPAALYHYGRFHEGGEYTEKNVQKAFESYIDGAAQGHIPSVYARGRLLYKHAESDGERQKALEDIRWAATRDYSSAIVFLEKLK